MKPLAIDLYCGLGGWTEGLLAEGYRVVGFDHERHVYGEARYPAQLVIADVLTLHGSQFKDAALIVASPPCQEFSYMAMPWSIAKQKAAEYRDGTRDMKQLTALFDACFRIQREACEAAGRHIPLVVENVCGAQKWVGRARWHFGSFYLWGDVPALMPITRKHVKVNGFRFDGSGKSFQSEAVKVGGLDWKHPDDPRHRKGQAFNPAAQGREVREGRGTKNNGGSWFNVAHNTTSGHANNARDRIADVIKAGDRNKARATGGHEWTTGFDEHLKGAGHGWFNDAKRKGGTETGRLSRSGSKSSARKAASAHIAKIPFVLAQWIARTYYPC